jgi:hypothetical protein
MSALHLLCLFKNECKARKSLQKKKSMRFLFAKYETNVSIHRKATNIFLNFYVVQTGDLKVGTSRIISPKVIHGTWL